MLRKIVTLLSGNLGAQLVNVATLLWVVATYVSPEQFGQYAVLMAYVGILSAIACLRYEIGIVAARNELAARNLVGLSIVVAAVISLLTAVLAAIAGLLWSDDFLFDVPLIVLIAAVFLKALTQVTAAVLYRGEAYRHYSIIKLIQALALLTGFYWAGIQNLGAPGLMLATLVSYAVFCVLALAHSGVVRIVRGVRPVRMAAIARREQDYLLYNTPQALIDNLLANGMQLVLIGLAGPAVTGYYSYLQRVVRAPLSLIFGAVSQVVFRFASIHRDRPDMLQEQLRRLAIMAWSMLAVIAGGLVVVSGFFDSFGFLERWSALAEYVPAFAAWMLAPFVFSPFATLPIVFRRQRVFFYLAAGYNLLSLLALSVFVWAGYLIPGFLAMGILSLLYFLLMYRWVYGLPCEG